MSVSSDVTGLTDDEIKSVSVNRYEKEFEDEDEKEFFNEEIDSKSTGSQKSTDNEKLIKSLLDTLDDEDLEDTIQGMVPRTKFIDSGAPSVTDEDYDEDEEILKIMREAEEQESTVDVQTIMDESLQQQTNQALEELVENSKKTIKHDVVVNCALTNDLSNKILSARVGTPLMMKATKKYLCIGTENGLVLVYRRNQTYKRFTILGTVHTDPKNPKKFVSVKGLDVSHGDQDLLLVGYSNGDLTVWDIETSTPVNQYTGISTNSIRHCAILSDNSVIASDESYTMHSIQTGLFSNISSSKIPNDTEFTTDIQSLPTSQGGNALDSYNIFAVATRKSVTIYSKLSEVKPLKKIDLSFISEQTGDDPCHLAWRRILIPNGEYGKKQKVKTTEDPRLAIGFGKVLCIYKVAKESEMTNNLEVTQESSFDIDEKIAGVIWISQRTVLVIDIKNECHIIDVYSFKIDEPIVESINKFPINSHHLIGYHGIIEEGEVLTEDTLKVNHESGTIYFVEYPLDGNIYSIHTIKISTWKQRIQALEKVGKISEAVEFAVSCYHGQCFAVVGLPFSNRAREKLVSKEIERLVMNLFKTAPKLIFSTPEDISKFEEIGRECINYCLEIHEHNPEIFLKLYQKFHEKGEEDRFLQYLEEPILEKRLNTLFDPNIYLKFISLYSDPKNPKLDELESVLLNLEITKNFDDECKDVLNELCKKSFSHTKTPKMIKTYFYLHNAYDSSLKNPMRVSLDRKLKKSTKPLHDIVDIENVEVQKAFGSPEIGETVLNYLYKWMKDGRSFSDVLQVSQNEVADIKKDLLEYIFPVGKPLDNNFLIALLEFRKKFFKVLSALFFTQSATSPFNHPDCSLTKNAIIQKLNILFEEKEIFEKYDGGKGIVWYYDFLAEAYAKGEISLVKEGTQEIDKDMFEKIFQNLCENDDGDYDNSIEKAQTKQSRQENLIKIIDSIENEDTPMDWNKFRKLSYENEFYKVAGKLFKNLSGQDISIQEKHNKVLECLLKDENVLETKRNLVFGYIEENRSLDKLPKMKTAIINHFVNLLKLDANSATNIILTVEGYDTEHLKIKSQLNSIKNEKEKKRKN
eukprot:gene3850-7010_t